MVEHNHDSTKPSPPLTAPLAQQETAASEENPLSQSFDVVALPLDKIGEAITNLAIYGEIK